MGSQTRISARRDRDTNGSGADTNAADCAWLLRFSKSLVRLDESGAPWLFAVGSAMVVGVRSDTFVRVPQRAVEPANRSDAALVRKFTKPLKRAMRLSRGGLLEWAGPAWWEPDAPCMHCGGTGSHNGTYANVVARFGRLKDNRHGLDRNLLARVLECLTSDVVEVVQPTDKQGERPLVLGGSRHGHLVRAAIAPVRNVADDATVFIG